MVATFLDHNNRELEQRRRRRQREQQTKQQVKISKKTLHFASRFFCTFLSRCGHNCDMKISDFTCPLYGVRKQNTNFFSFSFSKLRYGPFEFSPRKFHQYLTHQRVTKFETVRVHFLSDVFGLLSSRKFATMAT